MICPYCVEEVPANSQKHDDCGIDRNKSFPPFYVDFHGDADAPEPVILSVVGFKGHGKTVFLCALFEYLDHHLTAIWPDFFNQVLDQESLSTLNANREKLDDAKLPARTEQSFPRPGIFRLTNMPRSNGQGDGLPPMEDTTVLIYDPPGEAFVTEDKIVEFASFVKRSSCVLFLIDLTSLDDSVASKMAKLLDTYLLGMRRMGIEKKSQHMIVVYTKSDEMKVSVPEFWGYVEREPQLKEYLTEQRPTTLADPHEHFRRLEHISKLLETFTRDELNAGKFMHVARDWFASVSYTAVSSLGAAPEKDEDGNGDARDSRLTVKMSPRGVADPLLYVLAKSIKVKEEPPEPKRDWVVVALVAAVIGFVVLAAVVLLARAAFTSKSQTPARPGTSPAGKDVASPGGPTRTATPSPSNVKPPPGMTYVPGGDLVMGNPGGDEFERPTHKETVGPFFLDVYEVTCEAYARFIKATGHSPPRAWRDGQYPPDAAQHPVTGVNWYDAAAYAHWAGKRLPTEYEWEFAARGPQGRLYPWGAEWEAGAANARGAAAGGLTNVGQFQGASPFGAYDMIGNAWEWTASDLKPYPGGKLPFERKKVLKVIRGGSWKAGPQEATTTYRGYLQASGSKDYSNTGFRCAQDVHANAGADVSSTR